MEDGSGFLIIEFEQLDLRVFFERPIQVPQIAIDLGDYSCVGKP